MSQEPRPDYDQLPPAVHLEDTVAHQLEVERYGGPGGGGGDLAGLGPADGADGD